MLESKRKEHKLVERDQKLPKNVRDQVIRDAFKAYVTNAANILYSVLNYGFLDPSNRSSNEVEIERQGIADFYYTNVFHFWDYILEMHKKLPST